MTSGFSDSFPLRKGRTHEVCGPAATAFAFALGGRLDGPVLWICEGWRGAQINPAGFGAYLDPHRLLLARAGHQREVLAVAEEVLRSGAVALAVMEISEPVSLTAGRRLQLAAEAGKSTGLCLVPEGAGSNAAETRWRCASVFDATDSTLQRWEIIKNKSGTLCAWNVKWDAEARRVSVVSKAAERSGVARAPV